LVDCSRTRAFPCIQAGKRGRSDRGPAYDRRVRVVFITYLVVIVSGITFFTVVGLTHH